VAKKFDDAGVPDRPVYTSRAGAYTITTVVMASCSMTAAFAARPNLPAHVCGNM